MPRVALLLVAALALSGCEEETVAGGANTRGPETPARPQSAASAPRAPIGAFAQRERRPAFPSAPARAATPARPSAGAAAPADEVPPAGTDPDDALRRALTEAFGDPSSCLSDAARDQAGERLRLQVTVRVTGSGRPINASVSGGGLPEADLACMTRRAESLRLPSPVPDAPRTISTSIEYAVNDTRTNESESTPADPGRHRGTLRADRTLPPAGTATERPRGFVQPSRTLPPTAEPAQARGYVAPGSTLPAQAPPVSR